MYIRIHMHMCNIYIYIYIVIVMHIIIIIIIISMIRCIICIVQTRRDSVREQFDALPEEVALRYA